MNDIRECYEALELEYGASLDQVDKAYRELTKVWHPDRFLKEDPSLQEKARHKQRQINVAYERLQARPLPTTPPPATGVPGQEMQQVPVADPVVAPPPAPAPTAVRSPLARVGHFLSEYVGPALRDAVLPAVMAAISRRRREGAAAGRAGTPDAGAGCPRPRQRGAKERRGEGRGPGRGGRRGPGRGRR